VSDRLLAAALFVAVFLIYNANGREVGNYDSQPTKYAARELLLRGTLALNYVVGATPQLMERPAFVAARDGRYRSAYSPVPAIVAAGLCWPLWKAGVIDIRSPLGANVIAKLSASILTSAAIGLAFLAARRYTSSRRAAFVALALGLGTGYWSTTSQTLWQHETVAFGLGIAVLGFTAPDARIPALLASGAGLALAGTSRPQLAPAVAVLLLGVVARAGWRRAMIPVAIAGVAAAALITAHMQWFGTILGGMPILEALHPRVHATESTFTLSTDGFLGLWISPNRGLLVFSPVVLGVLAGYAQMRADRWRGAQRPRLRNMPSTARTPSGGAATRTVRGTCSTCCHSSCHSRRLSACETFRARASLPWRSASPGRWWWLVSAHSFFRTSDGT
jgi:hypothetical protein